jgi:hypothetical protein
MNLLSSLVRAIGIKGTVVVGVVMAGVYFLAPASVKQALLSALSGGSQGGGQAAPGAGSACELTPANARAHAGGLLRWSLDRRLRQIRRPVALSSPDALCPTVTSARSRVGLTPR